MMDVQITLANANVWVALTGKSQPLTPYIAPDIAPVLVAEATPTPTVEQPTAAGELPSANIDDKAPHLIDAKEETDTSKPSDEQKLAAAEKPAVSALKPTALVSAGIPIPMPRIRVAA